MSGIKMIPGLLSDLYHIFSASRRCYAIQLLSQRGYKEYPVRELAREITAIEHGIPKNDATGEPYRNVYNALCQTHLNTLSDTDLVVYNKRRQTITPRPRLRDSFILLRFNLSTYMLLCNQPIENKNQARI